LKTAEIEPVPDSFALFDSYPTAGKTSPLAGVYNVSRGSAMAGLREIVLLPGTLRGEGRERSCRVRAMKVTLQVEGQREIEYADVGIADSDDFLDGNYEVTFAGKKALLTRKDGHYLARQ
jgi:hypothetical protein